MRQILIYITLSLVLLAGCRQTGTDSPRLVELDSLIAVAPDSAVALLLAMPTDSLPTANDRAYHALLLTQAKYKAYIPATDDSLINLAVHHFVTHGNGDYDRRIRSLIYKGCVMTELGQPDSAIYWFSRAETAAHRDDHANLGYIYFRMGRLYQNQNSAVDRTIQKFQNSITHSIQSNDSSRLLYSLMEIGSVYRNENKDSALRYLNQAKRLAQDLKDTLSYSSCLINEAYVYYLKGDYDLSRRLTKDALAAGTELGDSAGAMMIAAMSLAKLGQADSASFYINQLHFPEDSATQVLYYDMCAQICQARHDQLGYLSNIRQSESIAGDILNRSLQQKLIDTEKDLKLQLAESESRKVKQKSRFVCAIALLLLLLAGIVFTFWQKRQKLNLVRKQNQINRLFFDLNEMTRQSESLSLQNENLSHTAQELVRKVEMAKRELATMQSKLDKKQQVIDNKNKRISEMAKDSANYQSAHAMGKRMTKSLEYIAGILHTFIMQSYELKPSEFLNKFRSGFLDSPKGGEVDFWYTLRTQADLVYEGALEKLLVKHPDLSEKNIKVICMLALCFSSEMMATCLQHKSSYIETMKNRLKDKLGISCSIPEYLKQLSDTAESTKKNSPGI